MISRERESFDVSTRALRRISVERERCEWVFEGRTAFVPRQKTAVNSVWSCLCSPDAFVTRGFWEWINIYSKDGSRLLWIQNVGLLFILAFSSNFQSWMQLIICWRIIEYLYTNRKIKAVDKLILNIRSTKQWRRTAKIPQIPPIPKLILLSHPPHPQQSPSRSLSHSKTARGRILPIHVIAL